MSSGVIAEVEFEHRQAGNSTSNTFDEAGNPFWF